LRSTWCTRANSTEAADSETSKEAPRDQYELHWVGHPQEDDQLLREGHQWPDAVGGQDSGDAAGPAGVGWDAGEAWTVAMEATMFTGWIYDYLRPHAAAVKVAHPLMLRAIAVAKKKNDRIDAGRIKSDQRPTR
jgi:hypothetical protein